MATPEYEDFSIDYVTAVVDVLVKSGASLAVYSTYFSGPAARLPSVAAKANTVATQLSELDFNGIRDGLSVEAKLQGPLIVEAIVGKALVAIDLMSRTADVIEADSKVSRTAANLFDFGGAIAATKASAAAGAMIGFATFPGPGTVIGGVVGGLSGALSYTVVSLRYDLVDLLQEGIQAVGKGLPAALFGVLKDASSWEVDQLGNPSYPAGLYDEVAASGATGSQGNGNGPSDPHDPRGQWQTPSAPVVPTTSSSNDDDDSGWEPTGQSSAQDRGTAVGTSGGFGYQGDSTDAPSGYSTWDGKGGGGADTMPAIDPVRELGDYSDKWGGEIDVDVDGPQPILLDLDGDGIEITELSKSTVFTDTSGDGLDHRTAWAGAGDGVLFIDADGNGQLSNSHEYVFTEWADGARDDLDGLRRAFDSNGDGKLTKADARWYEFRVQVTGADGSQEVKTLGQLGITELDLTADATEIVLADGSAITGQSSFVMSGVTRVLANTRLMAEAQGYRVEEVVSEAAGGTRTVTQSGYDQTGDRVFVVTSVTSANGQVINNQFDLDGDGVVDQLQTLRTVFNTNGSRTEAVINRQGSDAETAVLLDRTVTTTSADGKQVTIQRDTTGGGWFDQTEVRTTAANGSRMVVIQDLAKDGSVIRSSTETQTANGLTRVRSDNLDGIGAADRITTETLSEDAAGVRTEVTSVTNRDGSQRVSETVEISADGKTRTTSVDLNGDGVADQKTTLVTALGASGNTSSVQIIRNANDSLVTQTNSTVSADGLVRTTSQKLDGDADFDRFTNDTVVIDATGNRTQTITVTNTDGSVNSMTKTWLGADKTSYREWVDLDQNGVLEATC